MKKEKRNILSIGIINTIWRWLSEHNIIFVVIIVSIILSFTSDKFLSVNNLFNVLRQTSMVAIVAIGAFYVIVGGGIDLSSGAIVGISGIIFAKMLVEYGYNPWIAFIIALLFGMGCGLVNAILVSVFNVPPIVATLGTLSIYRGLCYIITDAYPISGLPQSISFVGRGYLWIVPVPVIIMIAVYLIANFVSQRTKFGRFVYAVGSNIDASRFSGINTKRIQAITFIIAGLMSGIAGIILTSRIASGQPNAGIGWELDAITAVVIGGVSIMGGKGKLLGVFFGALLVGLLTNGMTLLNMDSYYQQIVKGFVLVLAIAIDVARESRKNKI